MVRIQYFQMLILETKVVEKNNNKKKTKPKLLLPVYKKDGENDLQ